MSNDGNHTAAMTAAPPTALAETGVSAQVAQMQAVVLMRYQVAAMSPRRAEDCRTAMLKDCRRPVFAEKARWKLPFRAKNPETGRWETTLVRGLSIRFAEAAVLHYGNVWVESRTTHEDDDKVIVAVSATDLQTNASFAKDVVTRKTVERHNAGKRTPLGKRENSYGEQVYILRATEEEAKKLVAANVAKARRDCILPLIPADIREECERQCEETEAKKDAEDPDAATRQIVDAYATLGIKASQLEQLIGHGLESITTGERASLRGYYQALKDEEATWPEIVAAVTGKPAAKGEDDPNAKLRADLQRKAEEQLEKVKAKQGKRRTTRRAKPSEPAKPPPAERDPGDDSDLDPPS